MKLTGAQALIKALESIEGVEEKTRWLKEYWGGLVGMDVPSPSGASAPSVVAPSDDKQPESCDLSSPMEMMATWPLFSDCFSLFNNKLTTAKREFLFFGPHLYFCYYVNTSGDWHAPLRSS